MNILSVYAHEDPMSFGAALHNRAVSYFEKNGHKVDISDLYASGFQAVAAKWDFKLSGGAHQNYTLEQQRAATGVNGSAFAEDIQSEIVKIRAADLILFEFPLWWSSPPAIMKGWFDKVFAMGIAWDGEHRYNKGLLTGKQALVITSVDDPDSYYAPSGMHGATVVQHLYPLLHSTLAHAGINVLRPFVAASLLTADDDDLQKYLADLELFLQKALEAPDFIYKH